MIFRIIIILQLFRRCNIETPIRIYFGPTDISKLHIKLFDEFGRIVDLNNGDYSFTLDIDVLYDL